jgi:hypothetical protein
MSKSQTVKGGGNTAARGIATISAGVTAFYDRATIANTVLGGGQTNIKVFLEPSAAIPVTYFTGGGSGTITAASAGDTLSVTGAKWLIKGSTKGGDSIHSAAKNATINVSGAGDAQGTWQNGADTTPSNYVALTAGNAVVNADGQKDLILSSGGKDTVNAYNSATVEVNGGAVTINAAGSGPVLAFFENGGGALTFINNSTVSATVSGAVPGGTAGSVTAFGGAGGGVYVGGPGGNNSLVGGSGTVTLVGAGTNNYLEAAGYSSNYFSQNVLEAGNGGGILVADSSTGYNEFLGGTGNDTISSAGAGAQTYYIGASGAESITGSTTSGAQNEYIFDQSSNGAGQDTIANFRHGLDHIDINLNGTLSGVTISGFTGFGTIGAASYGTMVSLSDSTKIYLYGLSSSALSTSIIGGTHI